MKRFFIFITTALLIAAAGYADRGYGMIKWEPMTKDELITLIVDRKMMVLRESEDKIILDYSAPKLGDVAAPFIVFNKITESGLFMPQTVCYLIEKQNKKLLLKNFEQLKLYSQFDDIVIDEVNFTKYGTNAMLNILEHIKTNKYLKYVKNQKLPKTEKSTMHVRIYKYNYDTMAVIFEDCTDDKKTFVFYIYDEPDY